LLLIFVVEKLENDILLDHFICMYYMHCVDFGKQLRKVHRFLIEEK